MHKVLQLAAFWFDMPPRWGSEVYIPSAFLLATDISPRWGLVSIYDEQMFFEE